MYKSIKRLIFLCLFILLFVSMTSVNATEVTTTTDDKKYNYTTVSEDVTNIIDNVEYIKNTGYTKRSNTKYNQINHVFVMKNNTETETKIATWAIPNDNGSGFKRLTLKEIAEDYQKQHPGWIVLAGINADQFYFRFGSKLGADGSAYMQPQPYYPMVSGGDNWFAINPYGSSNNVVGFKNDGSTNPLVYGSRSIKGLYIYVYDDNDNIVGVFKANDLNIKTTLGTNQTTVLAAHMNSSQVHETVTKQSNNGFYVIEDADYSWVSNSTDYASILPSSSQAVNAFFGKGRISKVDNNLSISEGAFAIETNNQDLKDALGVGVYVKCQYEFDDGFKGIEEAIGYHTIQRSNGKDGSVDNSYNTRPYPRSIFGADKNGNVYLITCEGSNSAPTKGMYAQESNALCKYYGISDAFQMDGGGSVTCVMRNENGDIVYPMPSIEGSYRYILSGLFIVAKVPDIDVTLEDIDQISATFDVDLTKFALQPKMVYLNVYQSDDGNYVGKFYLNNNTSHTYIEKGKIEVTGLSSDTEYNYVLVYENASGKLIETLIKGTFITYKNYPVISEIRIIDKGDKYHFEVDYNDSDSVLAKLSIVIGPREYSMSLSNGLGILDINKNSASLFLKIKMECELDNSLKTLIVYDSIVKADSTIYLSYMCDLINDYINDIIK